MTAESKKKKMRKIGDVVRDRRPDHIGSCQTF